MRVLSSVALLALGLLSSEAKAANPAAAKPTYDTVCATCHGPTGKGDGAAAAALNPKPADFSKSTRSDEELAKIIKSGGPAAGLAPTMPPNPAMTDAQLADMVAYIRTLK